MRLVGSLQTTPDELRTARVTSSPADKWVAIATNYTSGLTISDCDLEEAAKVLTLLAARCIEAMCELVEQ